MEPFHRSFRTDLAAALSVGAGLVHAAAAGTHADTRALVVVFTATAVVQGGLGVAVLAQPRRWLLAGLGAANLGAMAAWVVSRTVGLPVIDALVGVGPVGTQDLVAAGLAAGAAAIALSAIARPTLTSPARLSWVPALALLPAMVGVASPHDVHAHADGADHPTEAAQADHHAAGADHAAGATSPATDAVLAGLDTSHATEDELTTAVALVEDTRAAVADRYEDVATAEADGFVWIGDGRTVGRYQHYVHPGRLVDGAVLQPDAIESLVYENTPDGPVLVSTMYLLERGDTMDDVPDVAGDLTMWHDHTNLCFDATGVRLAGVSTDGRTCTPGGTLRVTPPMLHVWVVDHPCGPFSGIEGHGSGSCDADHGH